MRLKESVRPKRCSCYGRELDIYCSILSRKELLSKEGLSNAERKRIEKLLTRVRVLRIDDDIAMKYQFLLDKYDGRSGHFADFIIAATAWSKKLSLLTRNKKHFERIKEITLSPVYEIE